MITQRQVAMLEPWLNEVQASKIPELCSLAAGIYRDYDAVRAALSTAYSNGQTEAQVHRLKLIKRSMYGRANFDLLKRRVLHQRKKRQRTEKKKPATSFQDDYAA